MKLKHIGAIIFIAVVALYLFYIFNKKNQLPYTFNSPISKVILPKILHEISGLTIVSDTTIGCIQDENGIIFIYDFIKNKIITKYYFAPNGDYEGITKISNSFYVLRSDGTVFEIENYLANDLKVNQYKTTIPAKDNEGICYDKKNNQLLIACKSKLLKGSNFKTKKGIYSFNLSTKKISKKPLYVFNVEDFNKKGKSTKNEVKFKMSGIAIHPITNDIYVLSASDYMLFILNDEWQVKNYIKLDIKLYNKAEGITFLDNGDMLISNEGQKGKPTLLLLEYKNK